MNGELSTDLAAILHEASNSTNVLTAFRPVNDSSRGIDAISRDGLSFSEVSHLEL